MSWFKLDDGWQSHPKMQLVGPLGRELWLAGALHCARHLTDGRIDKHMIPSLAATAGVKPNLAARLLEAGVWHDHGDYYEVHDFLDYNPPKTVQEEQRRKWREAKASKKDSDSETDVESHENPPEETGEKPRTRTRGPSRPVPSTGVKTPPTTTTSHCGEPSAVAVVETVVEHEFQHAWRHDQVNSPDPWKAQVTTNRWNDYRAAIDAALEENPLLTPYELGAIVLNGHAQRADILEALEAQ